MSGSVFVVSARSRIDIEATADGLRSQLVSLGMPDEPYLQIMHIIENVLWNQSESLEMQIGSREEMGEAEGYACPDGKFIMLRDDVYRRAWRGAARDRFTAAHELGHRVLHAKQPMMRMRPTEVIPVFQQSEWQANYFAGALLMPRQFMAREDLLTPDLVAKRHGVSRASAIVRLTTLSEQGLI